MALQEESGQDNGQITARMKTEETECEVCFIGMDSEGIFDSLEDRIGIMIRLLVHLMFFLKFHLQQVLEICIRC